MRRKAFLVAAGVIILLFMIILFRQGTDLLKENVETVTVEKGCFQTVYKTWATVKGKRHTVYFNGMITSCELNYGSKITKDQLILTYLDEKGDKKQLKSSYNGFLEEVTSGYVTIYEDDYYLSAFLKDSLVSKIKKGSEAVYEKDGKLFLVRVDDISEYGLKDGNDILFEVKLICEKKDGWKINEKGNLKIILERFDDVLTVDKRALYEDEKGFYLISESWLTSFQNVDKYRLDVEVLMTNDSQAMIQGVGIENAVVCILNEEIRGLMND